MGEVLIASDNLIDLSTIVSQDNLLFEITSMIERNNLQGKNVKINLGDVSIAPSQLNNINSVLKGFEINIEMIYATSMDVKISAIELGITVSGQSIKIEKKELPEKSSISTEKTLLNSLNKEIIMSKGIDKRKTLYIRQTLRSGRKIEHDGNVVIIGDCNAGSEIITTGDILVWGTLSGIAHAGSKGDGSSSIRAFRINAIQLRIADKLARRPDKIEVEKVDKSFTPEEAKISEGEIVIYSSNS